jgi:hypothetical protein
MAASKIFGILQCTIDGLGGEPMANRIAAGTLFAFLSNGTGALASIVPVGFQLPERSH